MQSDAGEDFRIFLQEELVRRCRSNARYSLRAFARTLKIEPSFLSKILNRKRSITSANQLRFAAALGLGPAEREKLVRSGERSGSSKYQNIGLDEFEVISGWHHYAILELACLDSFRSDCRWIARALGLSPAEARSSVDRLSRLGMLDLDPKKRLASKPIRHTTIGHEFSSVAFRRHQRQILEKAIAALEEIPFERRDQSSLTVAVRSMNLPEAKKKIQNFRREMNALLQDGGPADQIYHLSISLYPVTDLKPAKQPLGQPKRK